MPDSTPPAPARPRPMAGIMAPRPTLRAGRPAARQLLPRRAQQPGVGGGAGAGGAVDTPVGPPGGGPAGAEPPPYGLVIRGSGGPPTARFSSDARPNRTMRSVACFTAAPHSGQVSPWHGWPHRGQWSVADFFFFFLTCWGRRLMLLVSWAHSWGMSSGTSPRAAAANIQRC